MNKKLIYAAALVAAAVLLTLYLRPAKNVEASKTFTDTRLGISFTYPAEYAAQPSIAAGIDGALEAITLIRESDLASIPEGGEGPTTMSFTFYQNNIQKLTADQWVTKTAYSNYKLASGKVSPLVIDGREAFTYAWDGLYRGLSGAINHGDWILVASVTTLTPEDAIAGDFQDVIKSVKLTQPEAIDGGDGMVCAQVITPARNFTTGEVRDFPTPCSVPAGWEVIR